MVEVMEEHTVMEMFAVTEEATNQTPDTEAKGTNQTHGHGGGHGVIQAVTLEVMEELTVMEMFVTEEARGTNQTPDMEAKDMEVTVKVMVLSLEAFLEDFLEDSSGEIVEAMTANKPSLKP